MRRKNIAAALAGAVLLLSIVFPLQARAAAVCREANPPAECPKDEKADVGFAPSYPSGPQYDAFVLTLPGLGLLSDDPAKGGNGDDKLNNERCQSDGEATLAEVAAGLNILMAAGTLCNALPTPGPQEVCFGVLAVVATTLQANATAIAQCKLQDAAVDAAEIEAAFENTKHLLAMRLEEDLLNCNRLLSFRYPKALNGRAEDVRDLVSLRITQYQAAGLAAGDASTAQANFDSGVAALNAGLHQEAYRNFCLAYAVLSSAR